MKLAYIGIDALFPVLCATEIQCDIVEIFSCHTDNSTEFNTQVVDFATTRGIPCQLEPITLLDMNRLLQKGCDLLLCAGYYHKIPTETSIPMVNLHPSLLPDGRGAWPMPQSILNGETTTGITLHQISDKLDGGKIILQRECEITPTENLETLTRKLQTIGAALIQTFLSDWQSLYQNATPQGVGSYLPYLTESDFPITSDTTVTVADRILRAFYGYECIYQTESTYGLLRGVACPSDSLKKEKFPLADGFVRTETARIL